jgi:acyl-CoA synthetase (AMP-forming)/AMP-acid ligase II
MEAKFVDEEENEVEHGKDGELWMRGPNIFLGYPITKKQHVTPSPKTGGSKVVMLDTSLLKGIYPLYPILTEECFTLQIA